MNILFLTIENIESFNDSDMYADVMKEFIRMGHRMFIISPIAGKEKRTYLCQFDGGSILRLHTNNSQNCRSLIKKGISTLLMGFIFANAIKKYFSGIHFNLVLYSTPPVTFARSVMYVKKKCRAEAYLMLKDIFPQNAVDIGIISRKGLFFLPWLYFRLKEKQLYKVSDYIGCMSEENVKYLLCHNKEISPQKVNICPNSLAINEEIHENTDRASIRFEFGIPQGCTVFVYGGNIGKPQGVDFIIRCLKKISELKNVFFVIAGCGTEYGRLYEAVKNITNVKLMPILPKEEYDRFLSCCDVGLIFLDYRFTISNFPSRLLSYTKFGLPVLVATDKNCDIGNIAVENHFGWWCESNDENGFYSLVLQIAGLQNLDEYGKNALDYHLKHCLPENTYSAIMEKVGH